MRQPLLLEYYRRLPDTPAGDDPTAWSRAFRKGLSKFKRAVETRYNEATLEHLLRSGDPEVRQGAALSLGLIGSMRVNAPLAGCLHDEDPTVCQLATDALWSIWFRADSAESNAELQRLVELTPEQATDEEVIAGLSALIRNAPRFAEAYNQRAIVHFKRNDFARAISDCEKVLRLNPYHFGAASGMGQCFMKQKKFRAALRTYRRAGRINPRLDGVQQVIQSLERIIGEEGMLTVFAPAAYHTAVASADADWSTLAEFVYLRLRTRFDEPGFALLSFDLTIDSVTLRRRLIRLKEALAAIFHTRTSKHLVFRSMARFDQQVTTKFHLDGGPPESLLLLGYEPSEVESRLVMADYTRASWELGIVPAEFIARHNPMFSPGAMLLEPYATPLTAFQHDRANLLVVNNSTVPFREGGGNLLGVMHQATIERPDPTRRRIINSTMVRVAERAEEEDISPERQAEYVTTDQIDGRQVY